ncbi:hypothetical protein AAC387_Pa09g2314 [Persea americana]
MRRGHLFASKIFLVKGVTNVEFGGSSPSPSLSSATEFLVPSFWVAFIDVVILLSNFHYVHQHLCRKRCRKCASLYIDMIRYLNWMQAQRLMLQKSISAINTQKEFDTSSALKNKWNSTPPNAASDFGTTKNETDRSPVYQNVLIVFHLVHIQRQY